MPKKPTFQPLVRGATGGVKADPIEYTPLMVIAGDQAHKLALHKDPFGHWAVSDPKSGAAVIRHVLGQYKGVRVTQRNVTLRDIRQLALADVENLIQRVGSDRFNETLANPQPF